MYFMSINKFISNADPTLINKIIPLHRAWVKDQIAAGVLVQAGKWGDSGGMIIVKAETREAAESVVNKDPLVQSGLITFETAQLHAAVAFKK